MIRVRHMIYSRFWHKFLYDMGEVNTEEPYAKRTAQGLILGPDGEKMSKSRGNVIDPNEVVDQYGADVLRAYVLFMGDYEKAAPWSQNSLKGCKRFIDRVWNLQEILVDGDEFSKELSSSFHKTIKKVTEDFENSAAYAWLDEHAQDYGFILRYPKSEDKQSITEIIYEPWHWRYVGVEAAKAMKESGQVLEEYLGRK